MKKVKALYKEFTSFEGSLFKYSLSFSLLLALAPGLIVFVMLFKFAYLPQDIIIKFIMNFLPYETDPKVFSSIFQFFLNSDYSITSSVITMCASFYLASRSIFSFLLISASHEEVDVPKWSIRIKSVILFVVLTLSLVAAIFIGTHLQELLPLVAAGIMLLMFTLMYRSLSFRKRNWSYGIAGAMFCTVSIMCLAALFITVINYFTSYKDIYGPLASLVSLLLAIYLISCIIYFGFCLNIVIEDDYGKESMLPLKNERFFMLCKRITNKFGNRF